MQNVSEMMEILRERDCESNDFILDRQNRSANSAYSFNVHCAIEFDFHI